MCKGSTLGALLPFVLLIGILFVYCRTLKNNIIMSTFKKLIEDLEIVFIPSNNGDWAENLPEDIRLKHFKGDYEVVATGLNVHTHRWYEMSTVVVKIYGKFLGITYVTNIFSETMDHSDCDEMMTIEEYEEFTNISYRSK